MRLPKVDNLNRLRAIAVVALALLASRSAAADLSVTVRQGLGGRWWLGVCPVTLQVELERGHVNGTLAWSSDVPRGPARQVVHLEVDGPARQVFRLLEPLPAIPLPAFALELDGQRVERVTTVTSPNGLISTRFLAVALGDAPGYAAAERADRGAGDASAPIAVACAEPVEMPESAFGFGPARLVVLRGDAASKLQPAQVAALLDWVHLGGRLVVSPGVPPVSLRDVAWLEPLLPATSGAPRTASPDEVERELSARPDRALEALTLTPREGAETSAQDGVPPLTYRRMLGGGIVELLAFDETALPPVGLRAFLTTRLAPRENVSRTLFGQTWELDVLRAAQGSWAGRQDGAIAVGLIVWALVLWLLSRLPAAGPGGARSPWARLAFRPAVALLAAALFCARRPAVQAPHLEVFAGLNMEASGDTGSGEAVLAATGDATRDTHVPLAPGRVRQLAGLERKSGWRPFYAAPSDYRLRAGAAPQLEGLHPGGTVPDLVDLGVIVPLGGAWSCRLIARDRQVVDGWITNGTSAALEAGYLMVDGFACALPPIAAGATARGPFTVEHVSLLKAPAGDPERAGPLPELLRQVMRGYSFPADGLAALPQLTAAVVGRLAVPPTAYSPRAAAATTYATCWLPIQQKEVAR